MFYAAANMAVCGYDYQGAAFETKSKRDQFCKFTGFHAVSAKEAKNLEQFDMMRRYPESIFNGCMRIKGIAAFTNKGEYIGIM